MDRVCCKSESKILEQHTTTYRFYSEMGGRGRLPVKGGFDVTSAHQFISHQGNQQRCTPFSDPLINSHSGALQIWRLAQSLAGAAGGWGCCGQAGRRLWLRSMIKGRAVKAFDCVDHNKLQKILQEMGIPDHLSCLLRNLSGSNS